MGVQAWNDPVLQIKGLSTDADAGIRACSKKLVSCSKKCDHAVTWKVCVNYSHQKNQRLTNPRWLSTVQKHRLTLPRLQD